ncbi:oligosaccharide flippase family protein [Domibacillus sp.]|uniref:lipopolysaccharide biosynthesis protein n=1 Tax=Domibacillus sp. TaxID=1969783 RepID=UPI0028127362|nr:oligosaccharide flippase family protein [Domibacillus sp.]
MEYKTKLPTSKRIFQGASFAFAGRLCSAFLGYINLIIIAKILDIEQFGLYSFIIAFLTIAYIIANFGVEQTLIYMIPKKQSQGHNVYRIFITTMGSIILVASSVVILLIILLENTIFISFEGKYNNLFIALALFSIPIQSMVVFYRVINQTNFKYIYATVPEYIVRPVLFFCCLVGMYYLGFTNINLVLGSYVFSYLIAFLTAVVSRNKNEKVKLQLKVEKAYFKDCFKFMNIQLLNQLSPFILVYIIGIYQSNSDIGFFRVAFQTATLIAFALRSIEVVYTPIFSNLYNDNMKEKLNYTYKKNTNWIIIIASLLCLIAITFSYEIMSIFGEEFKTTVFLFQLLCLNQIINTIFGSIDYLLMVAGKTRIILVASILQSGSVILLSLFFIEQYGTVGAAISILFGTFIFRLVLMVWSWISISIHPFSVKYFYLVLISFFNFLIGFYLNSLNMELSVKMLCFLIEFVFLFLILVYLIVLDKEEKKKLRERVG